MDKAFIKIILVYSAMKKSTNGPSAYSPLSPDTRSDLPSVRLDGARLVSAKVEMNHIMPRGHDGMMSHRGSCVKIRDWREKDLFIRRRES